MARTKSKLTPRRAHAFRSMSVSSKVTVVRTRVGALVTKPGFRACVRVGRGTSRSHLKDGVHVCAEGQNPRRALAQALISAGHAVEKRSGAFAGLK